MNGKLRRYFTLDPGPNAVPALDGLRGVAILMVVLFHGVESFDPPDAALLPLGGFDLATPIYSGWMGVNLFFVLSGFLITWHLIRRWHESPDRHDIRRYLLRRFLRIVPTYYVVLWIAAAGVVPHYEIDRNLLGLQVAWHLALLQDYLPSSILGPFWSLGVEEKFYLFMPVVLYGAWRITRNRWRIVLLASIALLPLVIRLILYPGHAAAHPEDFLRNWRNPFHLNLDSLLLGAIAAWVALRHTREPNRILAAIPNHLVTAGATLVAGLMLAPLLVPDLAFFRHVLMFPLTALGMALILFGSALKPRGSSPLLEGKLLARAGRLAYPWYLTHVLVLHWVWGEMTTRFPTLARLAPAEQLGLFLPVFLIASIAVALVLHFVVEKPCLILKDSLGRSARVQERESPALTPHTA